MYSHEIQSLMEYRNYLIYVEEYLDICQHSSQISMVSYNKTWDYFSIATNDGFYWNFKLVKKKDLVD